MTTIDPKAVSGPVSSFVRHHYRHFNAAALVDAAEAYIEHLDSGGKMLVTLAGAMSTAELGLSLAEMIRQDKVHAISCTGANLEEDIFNLVAHDHYERVPHYRDLTPQDEQALLDRHMNRVTDTCIPEEEAMRRIETAVLRALGRRRTRRRALLPARVHVPRSSASGSIEQYYQIDPKDSWMVAAAEKNLPMFVPGWEDSTLGNMYAGHVHHRRREERAHRAHRHRVHDRAGRLVHEDDRDSVDRLLPDRRRHRRRLPDLRRADAPPGPAARRRPALGLLLPDLRLDDELRLLLRRRPEREDHLGQARRRHPEATSSSPTRRSSRR